MIERLLFNWIHAKAARSAVGREHDLVVAIRAHKAQSALALVQLAVARTNVALNTPVIKAVPILRGDSGFESFLAHNVTLDGVDANAFNRRLKIPSARSMLRLIHW